MPPELTFEVVGAEGVPLSATPVLALRLRLSERAGRRVESASLAVQVRIDAVKRRYSPREQEGLLDLFGEVGRWGTTLRSLLWTHVNVVVPPFDGSTEVDLPVQCSTDLCVAAARYFHALDDGTVPLDLQFSGTCFYRDTEGRLQVSPLPWTSEAQFRLPVATWRGLVEEHHGDVSWLLLRRDVADALHRYRARSGMPTFDEAVTSLLMLAPDGVAG